MGRRRRRSGSNDEAGGHDDGGSLRWLLTYADMITLLMAFFIMLYSMSILNLSRFREVAVSIRSGFGGIMQGQGKGVLAGSGPFDLVEIKSSADSLDVPSQVIKDLEKVINLEHVQNTVKLRADERGLVISLATDGSIFQKGKTELSSDSKRVLDKLALIMKKTSNQIRVEGHTCNLPISSEKYPSNWELSTARATTVVRYLIKNGLPPQRLESSGYADTRPLPGAPNTNETNRAQNRRVDIVLIKRQYQ